MKLEIIIGTNFSADFILVSSDGVTGVELQPGDTATFTLTTSGNTNTEVLSNIPLTIVDAINGTFNLALTVEQTALLDQKLGFEEDHYYSRSGYNGRLDFNTVELGQTQAVLNVFVKGA